MKHIFKATIAIEYTVEIEEGEDPEERAELDRETIIEEGFSGLRGVLDEADDIDWEDVEILLTD